MELSEITMVSNFLFGKIKDWTRNPDSLILNIKNLGKFYQSRARLVERKELYLRYIEENRYDNREELEKKLENIEFLLGEYDKYLIKKKNYKNGNYPTKSNDT